MQTVRDISLSTYKPVETYAYYGNISISELGELCFGNAISADVAQFLQGLGLDVTVWDGSRGLLGKSYVASVAPVPRANHTDVKQLRSRYIDIKRSLYVDSTRQQLRRDLEVQLKLQVRLDKAVVELEQKIEKVQKKMYQCGNHKIDKTDSLDNLDKLHRKLERELRSCRKVADGIGKKVLQTRAGIAESETGFIRRFAILRTVFSEGRIASDMIDRFYKGGDDLIAVAERTDREAARIWRKVQFAKRFFVDAKMGLVHLYKVESTLKDILEHLRVALNSQKGIPSSTLTPLPSEVGVNYRLGYIRNLWNSLNPQFEAAVKFIKLTSLKNGVGPIEAESDGNETMNCIWEQRKRYGVFGAGEILPSYSKIEMANVSRTSRIIELHACASNAYKVVNATYDRQETWIKDAYKELSAREHDESTMNDKLVVVWERLLAISTENM